MGREGNGIPLIGVSWGTVLTRPGISPDTMPLSRKSECTHQAVVASARSRLSPIHLITYVAMEFPCIL